MDDPREVLQGGDSGPAIVPGHPQQSLLMQAIRWEDDDLQMPPKKRLTNAVVESFARWVRSMEPAKSDDVAADKGNELYDLTKARRHWAFRPLAKSTTPSVKDDARVRTPIDRYVLARLDASGLSLSPDADRATLIRRASLDVIGLPPTPAEVEAFVEDASPDAYEKLVDRLLASPHYGERWGRHWLDLARYADSAGFHDDLDRPNAWRYRDYVIDSLNADKPYGQFIREQVAGDELAPQSVEAWIATGFQRNGPSNENNVAPGFREQYRLDQLDGIVSTIGTVFMGVTLGCARCHDHKTDPFRQQDYYAVLAVFNSSLYVDRRLDEEGKAFQSLTLTAEEMLDKKDKQKPTNKPSAMALTDKSAKPRTTHLLYRGSPQMRGPVVQPALPAALAHFAPVRFQALGNRARTTGLRLAFANWIASPDNALTWRVLANRLWQHHFGRGIVATPDNFGYSGDAPSHPALLDYLAQQLIASGGRLKPVHKQIMMSSVYRQASTPTTIGLKQDAPNRWLWRMPKRRLEAEVIRDSILRASGNLNVKLGGPGIKPRIAHEVIDQSQRNKWPVVEDERPQHWRRSVYIYIKRQLRMPMLELFDAPTSSTSCAKRPVSTVPTQALTLLNGYFVNKQSRYFALRVMAEAGDDPADQVRHAIRVALGREATTQEASEGASYVSRQRRYHQAAGKSKRETDKWALGDYCVVLFNSSQFVYVD